MIIVKQMRDRIEMFECAPLAGSPARLGCMCYL